MSCLDGDKALQNSCNIPISINYLFHPTTLPSSSRTKSWFPCLLRFQKCLGQFFGIILDVLKADTIGTVSKNSPNLLFCSSKFLPLELLFTLFFLLLLDQLLLLVSQLTSSPCSVTGSHPGASGCFSKFEHTERCISTCICRNANSVCFWGVRLEVIKMSIGFGFVFHISVFLNFSVTNLYYLHNKTIKVK